MPSTQQGFISVGPLSPPSSPVHRTSVAPRKLAEAAGRDVDDHHAAALAKLQSGDIPSALQLLEKDLARKVQAIVEQKIGDEEIELGEGAAEGGKTNAAAIEAAQSAFILGMLYLQSTPMLPGSSSTSYVPNEQQARTIREAVARSNAEKAAGHLRVSLKMRQKHCGQQHASTLVTQGALAEALERGGKVQEALAYYLESARAAQKLLGPTHENAGYALLKAAKCASRAMLHDSDSKCQQGQDITMTKPAQLVGHSPAALYREALLAFTDELVLLRVVAQIFELNKELQQERTSDGRTAAPCVRGAEEDMACLCAELEAKHGKEGDVSLRIATFELERTRISDGVDEGKNNAGPTIRQQSMA
mmetsp:Transcript_2638/g.6129  ORF Transcript_2638/g.6129 Transcript_2638/m.6129 type:complete len:362 (-) Transcript_2638:187-1272(-)